MFRQTLTILTFSLFAFSAQAQTQPKFLGDSVEVNWDVLGGSNGQQKQNSQRLKLTPPEPKEATIAPLATPVATAESAVNQAPATPKPDLFWGAKLTGRVDFGASLERGNTKTDTYAIDLEAKAKWEKVRSTFEVEYDFEEDDDVTTEDELRLNLENDYFFRPKWFVNNNIEWERDDIAALDQRLTFGAGLGHQPFDEETISLHYVLGLDYLDEEFADGSSEDSLAYNWRFDYEQKFWDDAIRLFHNHRFVTPSEDTSNYVLDTETGLRVPLRKSLIASLEVEHDVDKGVPQGSSETDTTYALKIGYEW